MGYFTFTFANKTLIEKSYGYDRRCVLGYGAKGYIALPKGFENLYQDSSVIVNKSTGYAFIKENFYDGYGMFGEHDIYDVIVDINKGYIKEALEKQKELALKYCKEHGYTEEQASREKEKYESYLKIAKMVDDNVAEDEIIKEFIKMTGMNYDFEKQEWKRYLGIQIACYARDNELLKYPLKVTSSTRVIYEDLPITHSTQ